MGMENYTDLAVKIQEIESRSINNEKKIDELQDGMKKVQETQITLVKLANGIENMSNQLSSMNEDIKEVKSGQNALNKKVIEIENRPAQKTYKRMNDIGDKALWVIAGGAIAAILSYLIPSIPW